MESRSLIQLPAQVVDFRPRADRSYRVSFETRALTGDEVSVLADNFQGEGWLMFSPNQEMTPTDVPTEAAETGVKTPAQRLRNKIYRYWQALGAKGDFESFYRKTIQQLLEYFDTRMPEA
jgi:hypothetical protein